MAIQIIARHARSDFHAVVTAQGIVNAGASVLSVTYDGMHQPDGAMIPSSKFVVFAQFDDTTTSYDKIDEEVEKERVKATIP